MEIFSYSTARQKLSYLLDVAFNIGEVKLKDKNGNLFSIKPEIIKSSPLDVEDIGLNLTREEIIESISESRKHCKTNSNK